VDLASGQQQFHFGPMHGTNNLGEFLAIVHGLATQQQRSCGAPIYSDSRTAIAWVRDRRVGFGMPRTVETAMAWRLADRAVAWLQRNHDHVDVIKWPTDAWGEIPADFGRK
jgi:ribonuclease HI